MMRATTPAGTLARGLCAGGLACLAVITLASPGATRMYAWPWSLAYAGAILAPALALVARAFDRRQPLVLPPRAWLLTAVTFAAVVVASALASPYRGSSLLWSAPLLGGVAAYLLLVDWLQADPTGARRESLARTALLGGAAIALVSAALWAASLPHTSNWQESRNPFPLGHSNYTAGLAVLLLPLATVFTLHHRGRGRLIAGAAGLLALLLLFTSGSRGALLGLAAMAATSLWLAPLSFARKAGLAAAAALACLVFALSHARTRATLLGGTSAPLVAASETQRSAMQIAGWRMGLDRPLLGWGPGTTPLAYPKYRGGLAGGAENVLQLHSLPINLWAELGVAGLACLAALGLLGVRHAARDPLAAATLAGYGAFALTDWQLDVPVFAVAVALFTARLTPPASSVTSKTVTRVGRGVPAEPRLTEDGSPYQGQWVPHTASLLVGAGALLGLAIVVLIGRPDPTPELNVRALAIGRDPAQAETALALLRESLARNPDQEIAHFNLGWLLVVRDPPRAEQHFRAAAALVPDKGGVYFGLGLARLNQGHAAAAASAFALECLNDPQFLSSPWWREPAIAATRDASAAAFAGLLRRIGPGAPAGLSAEKLGQVPAGPERVIRRERRGYPVLMRNLDLPPPLDLYEVRELAAPPPTNPVLPPKGWLPSPLLLQLLDGPVSPIR
jgi:O-antigen ligase